jgi:hypothetical protein
MDARWLPILAAALGVLGGVLGALVGGWIANEGQENRFERERAAAEQDLRREVYGTYLGTAQEVWATALKNLDASPDEKAAAAEEVDAVAVQLFVAESRLRLVAKNDEVEVAAHRLREVLVGGEGEDYSGDEAGIREQTKDLEEATKGFIAVAQTDIGD